MLMAFISSFKLINSYQYKMIPDDAIAYIKKEKPQKLFNYYDYGGYLIYNNIKVFIDGRADMYSKYTLADTFELQGKGTKSLLKKYNFDMLIIPNTIMLNKTLASSDEYKLTKQFDNILIYEKV